MSCWSMGLVTILNNTKNHIISSNLAIVITDKYPKAKQHYLVLPKEDISTIFHLKEENLPLLNELYLLALNIIEVKNGKSENFKIGFHAEPSMQRVHLHVISKDFISDCLKTKKHWNSFNTRYFRPFEDVYEELKQNGCIKRWDKDELKRLLSTDLKCNQCEYMAKNIPNLKEHLLQHWTNK